jgi:heme/copper-type cytochrome/quinol oxidase subunit 2
MRAIPALLALAVLLVAAPAQAAWGMPEALTERGQTVEAIYTTVAILGLLVFAIVFVWLVIVIWRFRETTGHGRATHEKERHSIKAELAWFLIPLALVMYIGVISYVGLVELDHGIPLEDVAPENRILISGSQWTWEARYNGPEGPVSLRSDPDPITGAVAPNKVFYVPANVPLAFNVTATDVIHAFQVLDANHAYVMFVDANPLGATKYNLQTARLPQGDYYVQCNKMCLNPGHAIMRATIKAVPQERFDLWLNERTAIAGAGIVQHVALGIKGGQLVGADGKPLEPITVVSSGPGTRVVLNLTGAPSEVTFTVGDRSKTIRAGERLDPFFGFTVNQPGRIAVQSSTGDEIVILAVEAERRTVEMDSFAFIPDTLRLEAGKTFLVGIPNISSTVHDMHIGRFNGGGAASEILWKSESVGAFQDGAFIVTPTAPGTYEMWCNQPGHVAAGMVGTVVIT